VAITSPAEDVEVSNLLDIVTDETINEMDGDSYKYFPKIENIILSLVLAVVCCYCFVFISVQVSERMVGLLMKILIAPFALSGTGGCEGSGNSHMGEALRF